MNISNEDFFLRPVIKAIVAFAATNFDEFFILVTFFTRVSQTDFTLQHIILGQLIGFSVIVALSLLAGCAGSIVPLRYVALLGLLPLCLGLYDLYKVASFWYKKFVSQNLQRIQGGEEQPLQSSDATISYIMRDDDAVTVDSEESFEQSDTLASHFASCCKIFFHPNIVLVAAVMAADGSEEVAVFATLFSTSTTPQIELILVTFYFLLVLQCWSAYNLIESEVVASMVSRYSKNFLPWLLMGLGLYILNDSVLVEYL
jgi:cadmium resistance protein CadD (predicted permease)